MAVIDFYKHPFRQVSELQEPPLYQGTDPEEE